MHSRKFSLWAAACVLAALASCAPIAFERQEIHLRHDPAADAFDLLILYDGIQTSGDDPATSVDFAGRVSKGRREMMLIDWPFHFDFEKLEAKSKEITQDDDGPWQAWEREMMQSLKTITFKNSGYYLGDTQHLGLHQSLHVADAARMISLFERALHLRLEGLIAERRFDAVFDRFDARTRELWRQMATEKRSWLSLKDGVLQIDLPMTGACAVRLLHDLLQETAQTPQDARFTLALLVNASELKLTDERVILRWKQGGPTWTLKAHPEQNYDGSLAESLRKSNSLPADLPSRPQVVDNFSKH